MNLLALARRLVTRAAPSSWHNCRTSQPPLFEPVQFRDANLAELPSSWAVLYCYGIGYRAEMKLDDGKTLVYYEVNGHVFRAVDVPAGLEWRAMA